MRRAAWYFIQLALAIAIAWWLAEYPGAATIEWQGWRVDTSIGIVALAVFLVAVAAVLLYRLVRFFWRAPGGALSARRGRRQAAGYRALTQGMVAVAAGDAEEARRQARKADVLLGEPPLTLLLSAQAAQLGGDETAAKRYFTAMLDRPETKFLGLRGLLMQAIRDGARDQALALAERARAQRPDVPWLLESLFRLYGQAGRWQEAQAAVEEAARRKLIDRDTAARRRAAVLVERGRETAERGDTAAAVQQARKAHELDRALVPASVLLATLLSRQGHAGRARKVIERSWAVAPHPELSSALREIFADAVPIDRLQSMRRAMAANADHPETHLALAEAALEAELWGEARRHLETADRLAPSARVFGALARLEEAEHGDAVAGRRWLARAAESEADAAWRCSACGTQSSRWQAVCAQCGELEALVWGATPRAVLAPTMHALAPANNGGDDNVSPAQPTG